MKSLHTSHQKAPLPWYLPAVGPARGIPLPLFLPLPGLRSPPSGIEALTWDRGELPPPKLPRLAAAKNPGTLEKNTDCQWNKILNHIRTVKEDCSAPQPAPSLSPPASQTADSLPTATHTLQVPAATTALADLCSTSLILSVPPPSPTPNIDQETRYTVPKLPVLLILFLLQLLIPFWEFH